MTKSLTGNPNLVDPGFEAPPANPMHLFQKWLEDAERLGLDESRNLILSTVNTLGRPSSRVVFLRAWDERGIIFATGDRSSKGTDLASNPSAAGTLWWPKTLQQINLQGQTYRLSKEKSDEIFQSRTREAQSVAVASEQSALLKDEKELKDHVLALMESKKKIDRPKDWHAYQLRVDGIEFWHGSTDRFHKRLRYDLLKGSWQYQKLQP